MKRIVYYPTSRETTAIVGQWVYERTGGTYCPEISQAIALVGSGKILAGAVFEGYNGATVKAHIAVDGKHSLTREFLYALGVYAFKQLKVHKVIGLVNSAHTATVAMNKKWGYEIEGRIVGGTPEGDLLIMTMTADQCRYLE